MLVQLYDLTSLGYGAICIFLDNKGGENYHD